MAKIYASVEAINSIKNQAISIKNIAAEFGKSMATIESMEKSIEDAIKKLDQAQGKCEQSNAKAKNNVTNCQIQYDKAVKNLNNVQASKPAKETETIVTTSTDSNGNQVTTEKTQETAEFVQWKANMSHAKNQVNVAQTKLDEAKNTQKTIQDQLKNVKDNLDKIRNSKNKITKSKDTIRIALKSLESNTDMAIPQLQKAQNALQKYLGLQCKIEYSVSGGRIYTGDGSIVGDNKINITNGTSNYGSETISPNNSKTTATEQKLNDTNNVVSITVTNTTNKSNEEVTEVYKRFIENIDAYLDVKKEHIMQHGGNAEMRPKRLLDTKFLKDEFAPIKEQVQNIVNLYRPTCTSTCDQSTYTKYVYDIPTDEIFGYSPLVYKDNEFKGGGLAFNLRVVLKVNKNDGSMEVATAFPFSDPTTESDPF